MVTAAVSMTQMASIPRLPVHIAWLSNELPAIECLQVKEAEFLYEQLFNGSEYVRNGISIKKGDTIFDVGGNIGIFALYCILTTEGDVKVFSFEPIPELAAVCEANISKYAKPGVTIGKVFPFGLTQPSQLTEKRSAVFDFYPGYSLLSTSYGYTNIEKDSIALRLMILSNGKANQDSTRQMVDSILTPIRVECPLRTLSAILDEEKLEKIDLLKVDVEKAEWDVLMGIRDEHWSLIRQVVMEAHLIDNRVNMVVQLLKAKGFCKVVVGERSVLKFLGYREFGIGAMNDPRESESQGIMCNIFATRN